MPPRLDLTDRKFGLLTAIRFYDISDNGKARWVCRCECGREKVVVSTNLTCGLVQSCGNHLGQLRPEQHRERRAGRAKAWRKRNPSRVDGFSRKRFLKLHGITEGQFQILWTEQNGCCAICRSPFTAPKGPCIDHDHTCCPGVYTCGFCIRGLLCHACNRGIGLLKENPDSLRAAIEYIAKGTTIVHFDHDKREQAEKSLVM